MVGILRDGSGRIAWGGRWCPNPDCQALLLVHYYVGGDIECFPPETLDFDATGLPDSVLTALEEAIKCHAQQCYIASAIMVRKTLEEVCADQDADGPNLKVRLEALGEKLVMPGPMLEALQDLRLLGNDAAHIESKIFGEVGQAEVEVAIAVTKEILKATYQYEWIMDQLNALKATTSGTVSPVP